MRILIVNCTFPRNAVAESGGGGTVVAYELARGLTARGHEVTVFTAHHSASVAPYAVEEYCLSEIQVVTVNMLEGSDLLSEAHYYNPRVNEAFKRVVQTHEPDVVHFHALQGLGLSLIPVAKALGAATVVTTHDWWWLCPYLFLCKEMGTICADARGHVALGECDCAPSEYLRRRRRVAFAVAPHVDLFLTPSEYARRSIVGLGLAPTERVAVNENGLRVDRRSVWEEAHAPLTFGYLGGLNTVKGYKILLDAFGSLDAEHSRRARLLMHGMLPGRTEETDSDALVSSCGAGSLVEKFMVKARESPALALRVSLNYVRHRVLLAAKVLKLRRVLELKRVSKLKRAYSGSGIELRPPYGPADRERVLDELDVVVVPSLMRESYNLVVREAFLRGRPVIATRSGGPEEIVENGENGLLVEAGDVAELRDALAQLIDSPTLLERLASGASETEVHSIDEQVGQLEHYYGTVLRAAPESPAGSATVKAQPSFERTRSIGGQRHTYVARGDGFGFYLDDFFLYCLLDRPNACAQAVGEMLHGKGSADYLKAEELLTRLGLVDAGADR